jgi:Glycosyltransferase family 18
VTSQHPYAEVFIDEPHVFSVDLHNATEVDLAVRSALAAIDSGKVT